MRVLWTAKTLIMVLFICSIDATKAQSRFTISGTVRELGSGETMVGVNVFIPGKQIGTVTNGYGFYSLTFREDSVEISFSFVGYKSRSFKLYLGKNIELNVELAPSVELEGVEVTAEMSKSSSRSAQMSVLEIPVRQIKAIPAFLGEKDVLKVMQLMPGVQKGSEGTSGLYVRGGGPDQNLIILDDAPVYNAYHLFGFVSLFNGDAIKSIELTKGGFPARYGGRLSSILDIIMKDGGKEEIHGEAGVGIVSSRLVLEGPIKKQRASFLVSARRTYIDMLIYPFLPSDTKGGYFFYDMTAKANWEIDSKNKIFISSYFGRDKLYERESYGGDLTKAGLFWDNATATIRWNRIVNERTFSNASLILSNYRLKIYEKDQFENKIYELSYRSGIRDFGLKYDVSWIPNPVHTVRLGLNSTMHIFTPSAVVTRDDYAMSYSNNEHKINTLESGAYLEDEVRVIDRGIMNVGCRLSHFVHHDKRALHFEPRITGSFFIQRDLSLKASYAQMNQYVHLLSNTGLGLPTDLWVPATSSVPPQNCWQTAVGITKDLPQYSSHLSIEGYYKESNNIIAYKEGASFLTMDDPTGASEIDWEDNITSGFGKSYGIEFLAQRRYGKIMGWVGYTLSWTKFRFEELNFGQTYYARYDRRHDFSIVGIYELRQNITLSATWVFGTGNAITMPIATYPGLNHTLNPMDYFIHKTLEDYGPKNSFRMAPYHRLDFGIQFHKKKPRWDRTWEISVYNAYNRHNPYFYFMDENSEGQNVLKQVSLFPILPSISWSIKF